MDCDTEREREEERTEDQGEGRGSPSVFSAHFVNPNIHWITLPPPSQLLVGNTSHHSAELDDEFLVAGARMRNHAT